MKAQLRGRVVAARIDVGSKSERVAMLLDDGERRYVLRIAGEDSFVQPLPSDVVGAVISIEGRVHDQYVDISKWTIEDDN
jgi:hypothetical protein